MVGLSPCPPFGIYSRVYVIHFGRCPFFVLSQPSHAVSAIKIVEMDLDCGLLLAIKQTLSCVRGLLATYLVRSLFFLFVGNARVCQMKQLTVVLYCTSVASRCNAVTLFLFFWLPLLVSYSTLKHHPTLSLAQTCKVFFFFFYTKLSPIPGKCCCFTHC